MVTWFTSRDIGSETSVDELVSHVLLVNYLSIRPMAQVRFMQYSILLITDRL